MAFMNSLILKTKDNVIFAWMFAISVLKNFMSRQSKLESVHITEIGVGETCNRTAKLCLI